MIVKEEVSEDEGEVLSSSEEEDKKEPVMAAQGVATANSHGDGYNEVEGKDDMKKERYLYCNLVGTMC